MTALAIAWGSAALLASVVPSALAGEVRAIDLINGPTGTRAEIQLQGAGAYKTISLANPNRLVVDLPASTALKSLKLPAPSGVVTAVRTGQPVPGTFRVVFDLAGPITAVNPHMEGAGALSRLVIEWPGDGPATTAIHMMLPEAQAFAFEAIADGGNQLLLRFTPA
ncbi:AMIN domain-containing protein, partial [Pseudoxanthomonas sp. X-1]|uniref:AMIN domain-containing protein n=1 Tax=Pseudoxanthomonas sp. X-1 TaxID=2571115 RepID=UPI001F0FF91A